MDEEKEEYEQNSNQQKSDKRNKSKIPTLLDSYGLNLSLQLNQWLVWRPDNLEKWFLVPCPVGYRCLVVAHMNRTEIYAKSGRRLAIYRSLLPNDSKLLTVLDCIHDTKDDVIYVLDTIYYGLQNLQMSEAEYRFFWLKCAFDANPQLEERSSLNQKPLKLLPHFDCANEQTVRKVFMQYPCFNNNTPSLAGYLFYHKDCTYICGSTRDVGWIFPYMVKDVFGFDVHPSYTKPNNYFNLMQYITDFDKKVATKVFKDAQKQTQKYQMTAIKRNHWECESAEEDSDDKEEEGFNLNDLVSVEPPKRKLYYEENTEMTIDPM